jgi:hypothetical protein
MLQFCYKNKIFHCILINEILGNIDEIKYVIFFFHIFTVRKIFFTAVKHIFHIFTGVLPDYFLSAKYSQYTKYKGKSFNDSDDK